MASKDEFFGYSKNIVAKEYGQYTADINLENKTTVSGTIFTMDKKTPHPGVIVQLVDSKTEEIFLPSLVMREGNILLSHHMENIF